MEDIITAPPEHEHYDRLKAELVRRLSTSRDQRVRQLLSHEEMGDWKPSQFLQLMGLSSDVPDDFLRTIWASRVPPQVQAILAGWTHGTQDAASHLADKICEVTTQPTTASISPAAPDNTAGLLERVEELSPQVASLRVQQTNSHSQSRVRHRSQTRGRRRKTTDYSPKTHDICWYHWQFRNEARK